jgi:hypothetical protein
LDTTSRSNCNGYPTGVAITSCPDRLDHSRIPILILSAALYADLPEILAGRNLAGNPIASASSSAPSVWSTRISPWRTASISERWKWALERGYRIKTV